MSSFGFLNVSGIDGVGNGSGSGGSFPGGIDKSVQFNDGGLAFGGVSTFLYDKVATTLTVDKAKPNQIIDGSNSVGTAGQVLSSTGSGLAYVTPVPVVPGAPVNSVQFNNAGAFGGDSNFIFNSATDVLNVNGNVGIGSLSAPTDRLVVTGANATVRVKSTTFNNANLVLEDASSGVKQLQMSVLVDTADFTSIQQGVAFRNFRFNPTVGTSCISVGTTATQAIGGFMCSNTLSNRKIILNSLANDEHQNISLGVNNSGSPASNTLRFQLGATTNFYTWNAATASNASNELMRLTGTGNVGIGTNTPNAPLQFSNTLANRKIVLNEVANNDHEYIGLGTSLAIGNVFRFQIPDTLNTTTFRWFAGTSSTTSVELMRLTGDSILQVFGTLAVFGGGTGRANIIYGASTTRTFRFPIAPAIGSTSDIIVSEGNQTIDGTKTFNSLKPVVILDTGNSAGTAGQLLSSTGTAIQWVNPPVATLPGGANTNIQFNSAGTFGGSNNFTYTDTTSHLKVQGLLTVGNLFTTVPRIFAQSGSALFAISSWDDQWILAGGGSGASNSAGIGMGYNNTITSGIIACCEPSTGYKPIIYSAGSHDFKTNGSTRMTVTQTGGGDGLLTVPILQATRIRDGFLSTGTNGQVLTSTGIDLLWDELTPRFFFDTNATFQGTTGHRIHVSIQKKNTLYSVQVSMQRDGGIHFDLPSPGLTVGTQIIATLPVGWRPPASVDGIGYASNNNVWATQAFNWGSLNIDTSGNIRMRSPASGGPITNIQPNLEQITCSIFWLSSGTIYNSDGITR
jgi:hypothetical protein